MKKVYFIACILIGIGVIGYGIARKDKSPEVTNQTSASLVEVSVMDIVPGNTVDNDIAYQAVIEGLHSTNIVSKTAGTITNMYASIGSVVRVGQVLAVIENPGSGVSRSDASIRSAEVNQAEIDVNQTKKLYQQAKRVYEHDKTNANDTLRKNAKLEYESAQIALGDVLDNHNLKSPVSGTVTSVSVNQHESVAENQVVMTVGSPHAVKIVFYVSQSDVDAVAIGKQLTIIDATSNQKITGAITRISPQADPLTGKFLIEARPDEQFENVLMPGVSNTVSISSRETASASTMLVPLEALFVGQNINSIFVLSGSDTHVRKIPVQVSRILGNSAEINVRNFAKDDRIVVHNAHSLSDGEEVVINEIAR